MQTLQTPLYTVHANYILNAGIKKLLFRETLMWQADQASYYAVEGLLMFNLRSLEAPQDWLELPVQAQLQFHSQNLAAQIIQVRTSNLPFLSQSESLGSVSLSGS